MIPRYTRPELVELWSDRHRYETWLRVELAACAEMEATRGGAGRDRRRRARQGRRQAGRRAHPGARGAHAPRRDRLPDPRRGAGGRAGALAAPGDDVVRRARRVAGGRRWSRRRPRSWPASTCCARRAGAALTSIARRRRSGGRTASTPSRSRPGWCSPASTRSWGARARALVAARDEVAVGKIAGAVGTYANLDPAIEAKALATLGLRPETVPDADRRARSPRRLLPGAGAAGHRRRAHRDHRAPLAAHRGGRGDGGLRQGAEGLVGDAPQEEPDPLGEPVRASRACCARTHRRRSRTSRSGTSATSRTRPSSG